MKTRIRKLDENDIELLEKISDYNAKIVAVTSVEHIDDDILENSDIDDESN